MAKTLLLLGGGHAHLPVLANLSGYRRAGISVTVAAPRYFWYSGMGPGMLGGMYSRTEATIDLADMVLKGSGVFYDDAAVGIDPFSKTVTLAGGEVLHFDAASINIGSGISLRAIPGMEYAASVKPVANLYRLHEQLDIVRPAELTAVVIGGGLAGIETAANLAGLLKELRCRWSCFLVLNGSEPAPGFPAGFRRRARRKLKRLGVTIISNATAIDISPESVLLNNGDRLESQLTLAATGVRPPDLLAESGICVDDQGAILVGDTLQSVSHPFIFGGGDCINMADAPIARAGVHAVRQGSILRHNLSAFLSDRPLRTYRPPKKILLIANMGDRTGLANWGAITFAGPAAFWLKGWLDRRFMRRYVSK